MHSPRPQSLPCGGVSPSGPGPSRCWDTPSCRCSLSLRPSSSWGTPCGSIPCPPDSRSAASCSACPSTSRGCIGSGARRRPLHRVVRKNVGAQHAAPLRVTCPAVRLLDRSILPVEHVTHAELHPPDVERAHVLLERVRNQVVADIEQSVRRSASGIDSGEREWPRGDEPLRDAPIVVEPVGEIEHVQPDL